MKHDAGKCSYFAHISCCSWQKRDLMQRPRGSRVCTGWLVRKEGHCKDCRNSGPCTVWVVRMVVHCKGPRHSRACTGWMVRKGVHCKNTRHSGVCTGWGGEKGGTHCKNPKYSGGCTAWLTKKAGIQKGFAHTPQQSSGPLYKEAVTVPWGRSPWKSQV